MSHDDRDRWNARYHDGAYAERTHPSRLVAEWAPRVLAQQQMRIPADPPPRPLRALDVACGAGRNALYLASLGYQVRAIDIADEALTRARARAQRLALEVDFSALDLDDGLPEDWCDFDLIVVIRYLDLDLLRGLGGRLRPGGYLLCETHLRTDQSVIGPHDPSFRAAPGDLARAAQELAIHYSWEGLVDDPDGRRAALAQLVARRS